MFRKWINKMVAKYYSRLATIYFERMTHQNTMQTFRIRDDVGGVAVMSFTNKDHLGDLIKTMQEIYEQW